MSAGTYRAVRGHYLHRGFDLVSLFFFFFVYFLLLLKLTSKASIDQFLVSFWGVEFSFWGGGSQPFHSVSSPPLFLPFVLSIMVSMRVSKQQALIILACLLPLFGLGCVGGAVYKTLGVVEAPFDDNDKCTAPIDWKALNPLGNNGLTEEMESHKFVFVLGAHHSGTTLLGLILGLHDQTASLESACHPLDNRLPPVLPMLCYLPRRLPLHSSLDPKVTIFCALTT